MKSQKGITLISLTIYIIGMTIAVAIITVISSYFYKNIDTTAEGIGLYSEYTKFDSFFSEEVNHNNLKVEECKNNYVVFSNGVQYMFIPENKGIYKDTVKICSQVESCNFNYTIKNAKYVVTVEMKIKGLEKRTVEYTLQSW